MSESMFGAEYLESGEALVLGGVWVPQWSKFCGDWPYDFGTGGHCTVLPIGDERVV